MKYLWFILFVIHGVAGDSDEQSIYGLIQQGVTLLNNGQLTKAELILSDIHEDQLPEHLRETCVALCIDLHCRKYQPEKAADLFPRLASLGGDEAKLASLHKQVGYARHVFGPSGYPAFTLIDHEGKVIYQNSGWSSDKERLLRGKFSRALRNAKKASKP